jgi:hypothetical protein
VTAYPSGELGGGGLGGGQAGDGVMVKVRHFSVPFRGRMRWVTRMAWGVVLRHP